MQGVLDEGNVGEAEAGIVQAPVPLVGKRRFAGRQTREPPITQRSPHFKPDWAEACTNSQMAGRGRVCEWFIDVDGLPT